MSERPDPFDDLDGPSPNGRVSVAGGGSLKLRKVNDAFENDFGSEPFEDLHGTWIDPTGAIWGVGGQFNAAASPGTKREGVVARFANDAGANASPPSSIESPRRTPPHPTPRDSRPMFRNSCAARRA